MKDILPNVVPMPHALGPEKAVLSVLFQWPEKLDEVAFLTPEFFHIPSHRELFSLISEQHGKGKTVELVSFVQELIDRGKLDRVGGASALTDIYTYSSSPGNLECHVGLLREKLARRMTIFAGAEMQRLGFEAAETSEILDATAGPISEIHDTLTANPRAASVRSVVDSCMERFQQLCSGELDPVGIRTSLAELDRSFLGLHHSQTVIISGYPGAGKTMLAGQLAADAALDGWNTLICSLEMTPQDMMARLISYVGRVPLEALVSPVEYARKTYGTDRLPAELMEAARTASMTVKQSPLAVENVVGGSVRQISASIRRAHRVKPLDVVVVDFAQRIRPSADLARETREQQLAQSSNLLSDLARELGFCLLLPSQLNKDGATKHAEALNEDADLHLQIHVGRDGDGQSVHRGIAVVKDRHHGNDGRLLPIVLDKKMGRFVPG